MNAHDMERTSRDYLEHLYEQGRAEALVRTPRPSWRRRLATFLVRWADRLEPSVGMRTSFN